MNKATYTTRVRVETFYDVRMHVKGDDEMPEDKLDLAYDTMMGDAICKCVGTSSSVEGEVTSDDGRATWRVRLELEFDTDVIEQIDDWNDE